MESGSAELGGGGERLSILMPAYNEEATVVQAVRRVLDADLPVPVELIIVENGSTDGTDAALAAESWPEHVRIIERRPNRGKGDGVRAALAAATGTYTTILDADLEYDPADLRPLLEPLLEGRAEAVIGTRIFQAHSAYGFWYVLGNRAINMAANMLYNAWISDVLNCFKVVPTDVLRSLDLREDGFGIDAEIPAMLLRSGVRLYEVPVTYRARSREEGKKLAARDGFRILRTLARCRVR
ncbi:MAG TPA: glycosyltransferase family 2 protein [Solirubrobacterales bacterium]|nr:glycosyltransferase family 2 protein [Solirubrobacterales bacterium]